MSESNHSPLPSCSKSNPTSEDERQRRKPTLNELFETTGRKLDFLQAFNDRTTISKKTLLGIPSVTLTLPCQQTCTKLNFRSLLPLGTKDSLEHIIISGRYGEIPQRKLLRSIIKANNLERRPRRRLYQNKAGAVVGSNEPDTIDGKSCPVVNLKKLRHQLAKERKVFNRFSNGRFVQNIRNRIKGEALNGQSSSTLYQGLSHDDIVSSCQDDAINLQISPNNSKPMQSAFCSDAKSAAHEFKLQSNKASKFSTTLSQSDSSMEMLHSLENLNLNPAGREVLVKPKSLETSQQAADNDMANRHDPSTRINDDSIHDRVDRLGTLKEYYDKCGSEFQEFTEIDRKTVRCSRMEVAKDNGSFTDFQDFSSGDDTRNLTEKLKFDEADSVCKISHAEKGQNQDDEYRNRSVQWNSEVDVIYYAGDIDGGKVVRREMEPLREEADQQARRNGFVKLALNKNLLSAFNTYKSRDPWVMVYYQ